ncbi:MAG: guanylate kinase [Oscillospiraceae bacterium]|nr:guanylate kinase [Oscillospiraceae bacterium]
MNGGGILVVSAPSGSGKGTVIGKLLTVNPRLSLSISYTSRRPRQGEREGVHYYFVSRERFDDMAKSGEFVEWDEYQGDCYGTSKAKINEILARGEDVVFDITIKGAYAMREHFPRAALVFLLPPTMEELERRLRNRGTETEEKILGRLKEAKREINSLERFDYYIVNDDVSLSAEKLNAILTAHKSRVCADEAQAILKLIAG